MGSRPYWSVLEATLFFGVELIEYWDWSDYNDVMPYDYDWEKRLATKLSIGQYKAESSYDFNQRVVREVNVTIIEAGGNSHDTLTIGIAETVVRCDWDSQEEIKPEHPIYRYAQKGEGGDVNWITQLQKFCDAMLNIKVDIQALYDDGKVGWRLATSYPN